MQTEYQNWFPGEAIIGKEKVKKESEMVIYWENFWEKL